MLHYESNFSRIQVYLRIPIDTGIYSCIFHEFPFMTCDFNNKSTWSLVFLLLAVHDKVSTRAFFYQRTVLSVTQASCVFCSSDLKTSEHLFIHCNFSRSVWMKVLDWWGIQCCLPRTLDSLLLQWPEMVHG